MRPGTCPPGGVGGTPDVATGTAPTLAVIVDYRPSTSPGSLFETSAEEEKGTQRTQPFSFSDAFPGYEHMPTKMTSALGTENTEWRTCVLEKKKQRSRGMLELDQLIKRIAGWENAKVGFGPYHPEKPRADAREPLDGFLSRHSELSDRDFLQFLRTYDSLIFEPDCERPDEMDYRRVMIYGLYDIQTDEFQLVEGSFYFAHAEQQIRPQSPGVLHAAFLFDISGSRPPGIYRGICCDESGPFNFFCASFLEWLNLVYETNGNIGAYNIGEFIPAKLYD